MVISSTGEYSIFEQIAEVRVSGAKVEQTFRIERKVTLKNRMALKFEGVDTAEAASQLVGQELAIEEKDLPDLPAERFYCYELIGLKVVDADGEAIGEIVEILENPANDIFVIRSSQKGEILIPAVKEVVRKIDLKKGLMEIDLIPGLLD
jgi:16S rRNA processing protein RimM